jgi:hypothetical protein
LKADSGWLGGYPRNLCVTGTFTQNASGPGCPEPDAHGDGLKRRRSPESVRPFGRSRTLRIRQDSAACVSLSSIHLSKSPAVSNPRRWFGLRRPHREESTRQLPGPTRHASCQTGDCCPLAAHQYVAREKG